MNNVITLKPRNDFGQKFAYEGFLTIAEIANLLENSIYGYLESPEYRDRPIIGREEIEALEETISDMVEALNATKRELNI